MACVKVKNRFVAIVNFIHHNNHGVLSKRVMYKGFKNTKSKYLNSSFF